MYAGYTETEAQIQARWERMCKRAAEIIAAKEAEKQNTQYAGVVAHEG